MCRRRNEDERKNSKVVLEETVVFESRRRCRRSMRARKSLNRFNEAGLLEVLVNKHL